MMDFKKRTDRDRPQGRRRWMLVGLWLACGLSLVGLTFAIYQSRSAGTRNRVKIASAGSRHVRYSVRGPARGFDAYRGGAGHAGGSGR